MSDPVKVLVSCGITEPYAKDLFAHHKSEQTRILQDPVGFIGDRWYEDINLGTLTNISTRTQMHDAFVKLNIQPGLAKTIADRPHDEQLLGHRDAVEWAVIAISGQHKRAAAH